MKEQIIVYMGLVKSKNNIILVTWKHGRRVMHFSREMLEKVTINHSHVKKNHAEVDIQFHNGRLILDCVKVTLSDATAIPISTAYACSAKRKNAAQRTAGGRDA